MKKNNFYLLISCCLVLLFTLNFFPSLQENTSSFNVVRKIENTEREINLTGVLSYDSVTKVYLIKGTRYYILSGNLEGINSYVGKNIIVKGLVRDTRNQNLSYVTGNMSESLKVISFSLVEETSMQLNPVIENSKITVKGIIQYDRLKRVYTLNDTRQKYELSGNVDGISKYVNKTIHVTGYPTLAREPIKTYNSQSTNKNTKTNQISIQPNIKYQTYTRLRVESYTEHGKGYVPKPEIKLTVLSGILSHNPNATTPYYIQYNNLRCALKGNITGIEQHVSKAITVIGEIEVNSMSTKGMTMIVKSYLVQ